MNLKNKKISKKEKFLKDLRTKNPSRKIKVLSWSGMSKPCSVEIDGDVVTRCRASYFITKGLDKLDRVDDPISRIRKYSVRLKDSFPDLNIISISGSEVVLKDQDNNCFVQDVKHIGKSRPGILTCKNKEKLVISKMNIIHNNKFKYHDFVYDGIYTKINVECPNHGTFKTSIFSHMTKGYGCKDCNVNGIRRKWIDKKVKDAVFYMVKMTSDRESFYKVGITTNLRRRKLRFSQAGFLVEDVASFFGPVDFVWNQEAFVKKALSKHSYLPEVDFAGKTECFSLDAQSKINTFLKGLEVE